MDVSALLAQYLSVKSQINYDQLQQTRWTGLHKSMTAQLSQETTAAGKWESSSGTLSDGATAGDKNTPDKDYKAGGKVYLAKGQSPVPTGAALEKLATSYANAAVKGYNPEKLDEYTQLDTQYDMMQNMYETLLDELNGQSDSLKSAVGNAAKDTGTIES